MSQIRTKITVRWRHFQDVKQYTQILNCSIQESQAVHISNNFSYSINFLELSVGIVSVFQYTWMHICAVLISWVLNALWDCLDLLEGSYRRNKEGKKSAWTPIILHIISCTWFQYFWSEGHDHHMCNMSPVAEWHLCKTAGVLYHLDLTLKQSAEIILEAGCIRKLWICRYDHWAITTCLSSLVSAVRSWKTPPRKNSLALGDLSGHATPKNDEWHPGGNRGLWHRWLIYLWFYMPLRRLPTEV